MGGEVTTAALAGIVSTYLARFQMLRNVPAVVLFTSKLGNNHEGLISVALFIGSLVADLSRSRRRPRWKRPTREQTTKSF